MSTPDSSGYGGFPSGMWRHPENRDNLYWRGGVAKYFPNAAIGADSWESPLSED